MTITSSLITHELSPDKNYHNKLKFADNNNDKINYDIKFSRKLKKY